jgi:hypothetical protein
MRFWKHLLATFLSLRKMFHQLQRNEKHILCPTHFTVSLNGFQDEREFYAASSHKSRTVGLTLINFMLEVFAAVCRTISNFVRIGAIQMVVYIRTWICIRGSHRWCSSPGSYYIRRNAKRVINLNETNILNACSAIFYRINTENSYHSIQNILSSRLVYEELKHKIWTFLLVLMNESEALSLSWAKSRYWKLLK